MTDPFRFTPDGAGIFEVANGDEVKGVLMQNAMDVAAAVRRLAPKDPDDFFGIAANVQAKPARRDTDGKMTATVEVDSPGWHLAEFGTANTPARAPIRKGARTVLTDFREGQ